ncbi:MAG: ABC transporter permease [Candidatus Hydrogenedentes bacterium]|nr:ABC transporter permease [Candidatus Hydrogenedentota bacterium]
MEMKRDVPDTSHTVLMGGERPVPAGMLSFILSVTGHTTTLILRRQRLIFAFIICLMPVVIPLVISASSDLQFGEDGMKMFMQLTKRVHIEVLAPLLALFLATMLVGEDVETQTIHYMLTRPIPRTAWVVGRFIGYMLIAAIILSLSLVLTFFACVTLPNFAIGMETLTELARFEFIGFLALLAYGATTMMLGTISKRPIIYGIVFLYGWQRAASLVPGMVDFLTIVKYTTALIPAEATATQAVKTQEALLAFQKQVYLIGAGKAVVMLLLITAGLLGITIAAVRIREYSGSRAIG